MDKQRISISKSFFKQNLTLSFKLLFLDLFLFALIAIKVINKIILISKGSLIKHMIESPIKRKNLYYPKDFVPSNPKPTTHNKRFAFNQDYQIDANTIKKYSQSIEQEKKAEGKYSINTSSLVNPQKMVISEHELSQDAPLGQHSFAKKPDINSDILKKPRFSMNHNEQISEKDDLALEASTSPGTIKKQLQNRQAPLPHEDPCRIELLQAASNKITKIPDSYIKYRSSANIDSKTWRSSEKDILEKFQESRMKKSMNELPTVSKQGFNQSFSTAGAKQIYDNFRKRQHSTGGNFGRVNAFLMSLKKKELEEEKNSELPKFEPSAIQKIKQDINLITKSKKKANIQKNDEAEMLENQEQSEASYEQKRSRAYFKKDRQKSSKNHNHINSRIPEYLVSYRSSLSYLKDLFSQTSHQDQYRLTVKIPKLFTQQLIFKNQEKSDLYETARTIFSELKIPYENLVIKRYTNCTMIIARNICLIWHFDGKRYLGGWQTQYLDEGCKHGLGLQWQPKNYVYYGQFVKNKKEGLGIYKDRNEVVFVGYWKRGKRFEYDEQQSYNEQEQEYELNAYNDMNQPNDPYDNQDNYYEYL